MCCPLFAFALVLVLAAGPARAGCVSSGTDTYTCSGDFSGGLNIGPLVPSSTLTVNVNQLTANVPYINWTAPTLSGVELSVNPGSFLIGSSTADLSALSLNSQAGHDDTGTGLDLNFSGSYFTSGSGSTTIGLSSLGGSGDDGSSGSGDSGKGGGGA